MRKAKSVFESGENIYALGEDGSIWRMKTAYTVDKENQKINLDRKNEWEDISLPSVRAHQHGGLIVRRPAPAGEKGYYYECGECGIVTAMTHEVLENNLPGGIQHKEGCPHAKVI